MLVDCSSLPYKLLGFPNKLLVPIYTSSIAAVQSCFCFIIVAAVIVLGIGALFLLFVLLYSQRVASQSCETLGELLHHSLF